MIRNVLVTKKMKQDLKRVIKRGKDLTRLDLIIAPLAKGEKLAHHYKDHALSGDWQNYRECHIEPDWLLIYKMTNDGLYLVRTGSHADLFNK